MTELEVHEYLKALIGDYNPLLGKQLGAREFAENILGFQDFGGE